MLRAPGGLAMIVVLSACATAAAPEPAHHAKREEPPVGDKIYEPTVDAVSLAVGGKAGRNCGAAADAGARHGVVEIIVGRGPENRPSIEAQPLDGLNEEDRTCVLSAAYQALESLQRRWGTEAFWGCFDRPVVQFYVPLGTPRPPPSPPPEF
jgi:hypothetical protein